MVILVRIVDVKSNIHNTFSCILNILIFLQDDMTSSFKKMFSVQHFGSLGSNQYDHGDVI